MLAVDVDGAHLAAGQPVRPGVLRVARVRRLDRFDVAPDQRRADAVRRAPDSVALRHGRGSGDARTAPATRPSPDRSCRKRELARALAEAQLDQHLLDRRPDDRLAVEALHGQLADPALLHVLGQRLERLSEDVIAELAEGDQIAAVLLGEQDRIAPDRDEVRTRYARGAAPRVLALRLAERRAVGLRRIGRSRRERAAIVVVATRRPQLFDGGRQRELRAAEAL